MPVIGGSGGGTASGLQAGALTNAMVNAAAAIAFTKLAVTPRAVQGTSSSGTAGTTVADCNISTGTKLVAWNVWAAQTNAAGTQLTVTITYADSTTTSLTTGATANAQIFGNAGDLIEVVAGVFTATGALTTSKNVTRIQVITAGTGTGQRSAGISALEV